MAELADALDLGSSGESRAGSTPVIRTSFSSQLVIIHDELVFILTLLKYWHCIIFNTFFDVFLSIIVIRVKFVNSSTAGSTIWIGYKSGNVHMDYMIYLEKCDEYKYKYAYLQLIYVIMEEK